MRQVLTEAQIRRAVSAACALDSDLDHPGLTPHMAVDHLIGLDSYRRHMGCPSPETLAAYAEDSLPLREALGVAAHERDCPVCRADVRDLQALVRQEVAQVLAATPAWSSPFVGRDEVRDALERTLSSGDYTFSLVAARPGTGKTRLVLETAVEHAYLFSDGVWYLPVGRGTGAAHLVAEIARAANVPLQPESSAVGQLIDFFADKRALLVLDDLAAHPEVVEMVEALRRGAPDLCMLASASSQIGVTGEREFRLPPLETPGSAPGSAAGTSLTVESPRLFIEHVRTFRPDFEPDATDSSSVAEICRRTSGMPLAVELAAARVRDMTPHEIARRMEPAVRLDGDPGGSLEALVEWSIGLLSSGERQLLGGLTVFPDTFTPDQAAAICEVSDARAMLSVLHDRSLLQKLDAAGQSRYRLLRPVRAYALSLADRDQADLKRSHRTFFLGFVQERARLLRRPEQVTAVAELASDLHNLRAAMETAAEAGDAPEVGAFGLSLQEFLLLQGLWEECEERTRAGLEAFRSLGDTEQSIRAAIALGRCLVRKGRLDEAEELFRTSMAAAAELGDRQLQAEASYGLGNVSQFAGRYDEAAGRLQDALSHYQAADDEWGVADTEQSLGWLAWRQGDYRLATRLLSHSLIAQRGRGDRYRIAHTVSCLANIALEQGRMDEARPQFEECLRLCEEIGYVRGVASALTNLGTIWQRDRDLARAAYCYERAIRQLARIGDRRTLGQVMVKWADLALDQNDAAEARRRFEDALRVAKAASDQQTESDALEGLGRAEMQAGRAQPAALYLRQSLELVKELGNIAGIASAFCRCAGLAAYVGRPEDAAALLYVAIPMCEARQLFVGAEAQDILRRLEKQLGKEASDEIRRRAAAMTLDEAVELAFRAMAG